MLSTAARPTFSSFLDGQDRNIQDLLDQAKRILRRSPRAPRRRIDAVPPGNCSQLANVKLVHIPYKTTEATADLWEDAFQYGAQRCRALLAKSGKLRARRNADTRIKLMPELPTVAEAAHLPNTTFACDCRTVRNNTTSDRRKTRYRLYGCVVRTE